MRRSLSDEELARLFEVADVRGRGLWYRCAFWAGLRRSEMLSLTWGDVDLARETFRAEGCEPWRGVVVVSKGKAKRIDEVPIHPDLHAALVAAGPGLGAARLFPEAITNQTRRRDFERAGIELEDVDGKAADLHGLRASLASRLARQGVPPQIVQRLMRHADIRTTMRHYVRLEVVDSAAGLARITAPTTSPTSQSTKAGKAVRDDATTQKAASGA